MNADVLQRKLGAIQAAFDKQAAKLANRDGTPIYAPAEMQRRLTELRDAANADLSSVESEIKELDDSSRDLGFRQHLDPLLEMDFGVSHKGAMELAHFIREDMQTFAPGDLANRLIAIAKHGDEMARRLHARYAQQRLQQRDAAIRAGQPADVDEGWLEAKRGLERLSATLTNPAGERDAQAAQDVRGAVSELRQTLSRVKREIGGHSAQDAVSRQYAQRF